MSVSSLAAAPLATPLLAASAWLGVVEWDVDPVLLELGPVTLRWYGLLFAGGFLLSFFLVRWMYVREGKPDRDLDPLLLYLLVATVVGARLAHVVFYQPSYYLAHPAEIPQFWKGGLASHGGVAGLFVALAVFSRRRPDQPFLWLCDRVAVAAALVAGMIRLGNLMNSEIVGTPTDVPWAFRFVRRYAEPRHPAQLYEAVTYAGIFVVLLVLYRRRGARTPHGLLTGLLLVLVFSARFLIEFVKQPQADYATDPVLRVGQWLSIPVVLLGAWLVARASRTGPPPAAPARGGGA